MSIKLKELTALLKTTTLPVYRDIAPVKQVLPYIVYSYISEDHKRASGLIYKRLPLYQVSLFTEATERDFFQITKLFNDNKVSFGPISTMQGDENDSTINHFYTNVRCVEDV